MRIKTFLVVVAANVAFWSLHYWFGAAAAAVIMLVALIVSAVMAIGIAKR